MSEIERAIEPRETNWIGCAICLNVKGTRERATTTINGYSVCDAHVALASRPGFKISDVVVDRRRGKPV